MTRYDAVLALVDASRRAAVRTSNGIMTATDCDVGRRIAEEEARHRVRG